MLVWNPNKCADSQYVFDLQRDFLHVGNAALRAAYHTNRTLHSVCKGAITITAFIMDTMLMLYYYTQLRWRVFSVTRFQ